MPVFIDEVIISVEVTNQESAAPAGASPPAADRQALVSECMEKVLDVLRQKQER